VDITPLEFIEFTAVFWAVIYIISRILPLEKYGLEAKPLYLVYKTKHFNAALDEITHKFKRFWLIMWNIGVASAVGLIIFSLYIPVSNLVNFFYAPEKAGPMFLLLPGITVGFQALPFFLVAMAIVMVTHEVAHGIASRLENIRVRSMGIMLVFLIFGAFVEPDEKQLSRASQVSKARIYGAGSLVNFLVAILAIIALGTIGWQSLPRQLAYYLGNQLFWIGLLGINVAIFNMLPLYPLDGDGFLMTFVEKFRKKRMPTVRIIISTLCLGILVMNIALTFIKFGPYLL